MASLYQLRPTLATRGLGWMLGMTLGAMSYGALLTLSINCIEYLRRHPKSKILWTQQQVFQGYIILVLIFNTVEQVENIRHIATAILYTDLDKLTFFFWIPSDIFIVFIMMLTDGLLVWRCYMVQKAILGAHAATLHHIFWLIPLCLWFGTIALGFSAIGMLDPRTPISDKSLPHEPAVTVLVISILGNISLNLFATSNIVIRLLHHRRQMLTAFGSDSLDETSTGRYELRITSILLESAALNIPLTIVGVVMLWQNVLFCSEVVLQVVVPLQSLASIMVIYQVAKGRDIGSRSTSQKVTEVGLSSGRSTIVVE